MDIYLIDGPSYVYRAFYAIKNLTDPKGRPVNAVYGFTTMLMKIINEKKPYGLAVCFDTPHPTARHELFEHYKAHRPETPNDLIAQLPLIKDMLSAMNIKSFEMPGYEADDVLATLATAADNEGHDVYIVTSDKDMTQIVGDHIKVYDPVKDIVIGADQVMERFGVRPNRVPEYMALAGDASDNIPGVKGIGEKTAKELLGQFNSLDELIAHADEIKKERIRNLIKSSVEDIKLSRTLAEINRAVPMNAKIDGLALKGFDREKLLAIVKELGFASLLKYVPEDESTAMQCETVYDASRLKEILSSAKSIAIDTETTGIDPMKDHMVGFSVCVEKGGAFYVPLRHAYDNAPSQMDIGTALSILSEYLKNKDICKIGHNLKFDMIVLKREGVDMKGALRDTMIAAHLLNPVRSENSLRSVSLEHLGRTKKSFKEVLKSRRSFDQVGMEEATPYAAMDAGLAFELDEVLSAKLETSGLMKPYTEIEMPLVPVLARMESIGLKVDAERLNDLGKELEREIGALQGRIYFLAGSEFNVNSPKQLGKILFEDLGLMPGKKKKTGYSTDVSVLEELAAFHELPAEVLNYRTMSKLKSTYVDSLGEKINPETKRLHTSFNQTVTATGRLSSSEPNLQNIPVRGEWGRRIRECFIAEPGCLIVSADYSQIELRVLAHLSGDKALIDAFNSGADIHAETACSIFNVTPDRVTTEMRRAAKTVNFGVIYGMSAFGLSQSLGISKPEAERYIEGYFNAHPGVNAFITHAIRVAEESGFAATLYGRRRPIPELGSKNKNIRQLGERFAVNTPVQGTAADIMKLAMIKADHELGRSGLKSRMILQVHDELLFETPESEKDDLIKLAVSAMQSAAKLDVALTVQCGAGHNWAGAEH